MDDLQDILGIKQSPEQTAALTELARRANDRLRIQNPTNEDYFVTWDLYGSGGRFLVPGMKRDIGYGLGQAVHPRYIAFKFFNEIAGVILQAEMKLAIDKENAERRAAGKNPMGKTFDDGPEGELHFVSQRGLLPNNQEKLIELLPKIILGVEEEWGMEAMPYHKSEDKVKWDEVMALVNRPVGSRPVDVAPLEQPIPQQTIDIDNPLEGMVPDGN